MEPPLGAPFMIKVVVVGAANEAHVNSNVVTCMNEGDGVNPCGKGDMGEPPRLVKAMFKLMGLLLRMIKFKQGGVLFFVGGGVGGETELPVSKIDMVVPA